VLTIEAANTSFIVFALTQPGIEPTIHLTRGEHTSLYTTNASSIVHVTSKEWHSLIEIV
jgi:hypothetical protein